MGSLDTAGTLLADIAHMLSSGARSSSTTASRTLQDMLDEARGDFQELGPLVNGRSQYEHDRRHESLKELRALRGRFAALVKDLDAVDESWVRRARALGRDLHRTQRRVAMRIFESSREETGPCLGAFLVRRVRGEEIKACTSVGTFQRFGDRDIVFVCDFCDGHLVWTDLESMPSSRAESVEWLATGKANDGTPGRRIVWAPMAVGCHAAPVYGDWEARLLCPLCEEEKEWFDDVASLQEHLEWRHGEGGGADSCVIM